MCSCLLKRLFKQASMLNNVITHANRNSIHFAQFKTILLFSQCRRLGGNQLKELSREIFLDLSALEEL